MNIQGKLHAKFDTQDISATFRKREFVIEYVENPLYPQFVSFQLIQDRVALIDPFEVGAMLNVEFNVKGRQWTSPSGEVKYFNSLEAWRIQPVQEMVQQGANSGDMPPPPPPPDALDVTNMADDDDLPF